MSLLNENKYGIIQNFDGERESVGKKKIPGNNTWKILMSHSAGNIKNKYFSKVTKRNNNKNIYFKSIMCNRRLTKTNDLGKVNSFE